jgi:hypothetical protein
MVIAPSPRWIYIFFLRERRDAVFRKNIEKVAVEFIVREVVAFMT